MHIENMSFSGYRLTNTILSFALDIKMAIYYISLGSGICSYMLDGTNCLKLNLRILAQYKVQMLIISWNEEKYYSLTYHARIFNELSVIED